MTYLAAMVVGALLAVSGAVLQSVMRNPLAEPYMLGMVGGGALFAVLAVNLGLVAFGSFVLPTASFVGSCCALLLVLAVARAAARVRAANGADSAMRSSSSTVVLAGFVVGGFTGSLDMLALSYSAPGEFERISKWLYGSLASASAFHVALGAAVLAAVVALLAALRRSLDVMELGRDEAECLGVDTRRTMVMAVGAVSLATSVSVAIAGAVGFVGLVVPHFVRRLFGPRMARLVPLSALFGALFLVLAEFVVEALPGGDKVGVGVVCAISGTPFFLWLLASRRSGEGRDV